jgi:hypothetical protein
MESKAIVKTILLDRLAGCDIAMCARRRWKYLLLDIVLVISCQRATLYFKKV